MLTESSTPNHQSSFHKTGHCLKMLIFVLNSFIYSTNVFILSNFPNGCFQNQSRDEGAGKKCSPFSGPIIPREHSSDVVSGRPQNAEAPAVVTFRFVFPGEISHPRRHQVLLEGEICNK